jgi:hypothetical protein
MRLTFIFAANVFNESERAVKAPDGMNGWQPTTYRTENYLDEELADAGIIGGELRVLAQQGKAKLEVTYWAPGPISKKLIARLKDDTIGQLDDGIGENGFEYGAGDDYLCLMADTEEPVKLKAEEDDRAVPPPPRIAIAARDGDIATLNEAMKANPEEIERPQQSYSPLQLAILGGHIEAVRILLKAGADPNRADDEDGDTPLIMCALANRMEDEESFQVAQLLLAAGADTKLKNKRGKSAKSYANDREKVRLASVL